MKKSFFERLTGSVNFEENAEENENNEKQDADFSFDAVGLETIANQNFQSPRLQAQTAAVKKLPENEEDGQLTIDMHQTPREIIIQSIVAGVKPDDLDISITRDMVTIKGKRSRQQSVSSDDFFYQELYWGTFSRSVILPQEIDVDAAEAVLKNGVLTIALPKLDKNKTQKIKVKND